MVTRFRVVAVAAARCLGHSLRRRPLPSMSCRSAAVVRAGRSVTARSRHFPLAPDTVAPDRFVNLCNRAWRKVWYKVSRCHTLRRQFLLRRRKRRFRCDTRLNAARSFPSK